MKQFNNTIKGKIYSGKFELGYSIEGEGNPVLVIGSSVYYPRTFSENLKTKFKFVFLDHRGFGNLIGEDEKSDYELYKILDDIELTRQSLNLGRIIILGHSGHGYMALEYAKKYPDSISHLVIISTGPSHGVHMKEAFEYWHNSVCPERKEKFEKDQILFEERMKSNPENFFIHYCLSQEAKAWHDYNFDSSLLWEGVKANTKAFDYLFGEVFRDIDITKGLSELTQPVFLALGKYDYQIAPFYSWNYCSKNFQDLTIRLFEKSAHNPQLEEMNLFDNEFINWFKEKN
ncbi:MAG: alpha/beta hydrolase [Leptospiraceae bacterium]|nr:alpha/beta hydrolase [Leptospiraceae bacterium]